MSKKAQKKDVAAADYLRTLLVGREAGVLEMSYEEIATEVKKHFPKHAVAHHNIGKWRYALLGKQSKA